MINLESINLKELEFRGYNLQILAPPNIGNQASVEVGIEPIWMV